MSKYSRESRLPPSDSTSSESPEPELSFPDDISSWLPRELDEESSRSLSGDRDARNDQASDDDLDELADDLTVERYYQQLQVDAVHPTQWIVTQGLTGISKDLFSELHLVWLLDQKSRRTTASRKSARAPSSTSDRLRNGDVLAGKLRILELISDGKMGDVYRAWHVGLDGHVAVKFFHAGIRYSAEGAKWLKRHGRLENEGAEHPHAVFIVDVGRDRERDFAALDFVPGTDLARRLRTHGPFPWEEACACVLQAARGLMQAHQLGRIQKGLSPSKLIYQQDGTVKLLDWGYSRLQAELDPQERNSLSPIISRSVDFLAPEVVDGSAPDGPRGDLYSLGCTLFQLITGEPPFSRHKSNSAKLHAHATEEPKRLAALGFSVPETLQVVLDRLLVKNPAERYASAYSVIEAINRLLQPNVDDRSPPVLQRVRREDIRQPSQIPRQFYVSSGPKRGSIFQAGDADTAIVVGRGTAAQWRITDDEAMSREHFRLEFSPTSCRLVDLNSRNGTFVNERRAATVLLRDGDVISVGSTILVCEGKFSS